MESVRIGLVGACFIPAREMIQQYSVIQSANRVGNLLTGIKPAPTGLVLRARMGGIITKHRTFSATLLIGVSPLQFLNFSET